MLNKTVKKLPGVLQTEVQKEFYAATFDQLFSPANVEQAQGFIGRRTSDVLDPLIDNYLDEPNKNRAAYQLEPIAYAVNAALEDTNQVFYEDLLNYVKHHGGNIDNHDRLFADLYYSFAPPIDVDKFLNYQNYLWLEATDISNTAPIAYIQAPLITATPITGPADFDAIIESLIIGNATFNTSANNQIIPQNFEFSSGMVVQFEGSLSYDEPLYVECVGRSIRLVREQSTLGFDSNVPSDLSIADYITIERGSCEGSPWTRSNRWFHEDAVDAITLLGQLLGGTIANGGANYVIGEALPVNIGDGTGGVFVVTSVAPFTGAITGIAVGTRGTGYSFATADETGAVPAVVQPLQWDQVSPGGPGTQWDPDAAPVPSGFLTIQGQDELVFDNVSPNGTFFGGVSYSIGDVITMSDGSTITVDNVAVGVITEFTITTSSTSPIFSQGATLTQVSVSPDVGQLGFTLTLDTANELGVVFWDDTTIVTGDGSGAIIEGVLASAVSRSNKASRPILEFKKDLELYNTGARYIGEIDYVAATENFADIHGQAAGVMVDGTTPLVNGDLLIFLNPQSLPSFLSYDELPDGGPTSGTYWDAGPWELSGSADSVIRFVWKVDLVTNPGTIALVQWDIENDVASASALPVGSSVLATQGVDYVGEMFYQFYNLLTDAYNWKLAQSKASANVAPLFNLYDGDGIALNDTIQYPSSDFAGSEIFSYKILTQEQLNALGGGTLVDDNILGFPVETKGFRQLGDVIFENDLEAHRTFYIPTGESSTEIAGYYFYKQFTTNPIDCTYISEAFETNWKSSTGPEELRVIDRFLTTSDTEDTFPLTGVPVAQVLGPANYVVTQGRRLNSSEFAYLPQINSIKLLAHSTLDQSFAGTGSLVAFVFTDITTNFELYVNNLYQVLGIDYTITLQDVTGTTVLMTTPPAIAAVVKGSRQASGAPGINEVVELLTYTYDRVQESDLGFFEIPNELENNPNNLEVLEQSWNEFTPHFTSIITEQNVYEGTAFGAGNNYRDTLKDGSLGTFILQNQSPMLKAMLCTSSTELDLVNAIRLSSNEYTRYKNKFIKTAKQLIKEGFTTQEIGDQIPVSEWVDECIRRIIRSREYDTAFNDTYMVSWNTVYDETTFIGNASNVLYTLTDFVDLEDKRNSLYVYIDEILQAIDRDYIISNYNPIQITMTTPPGIGASIAIRIFSATAAAHIPATPTKLGLYTASVPSILTDDTYVNPIQYILGHDGSRTPIYGSVIDELLLEFETRIYNGVTEKFRTNYTVPLTIDTYKPGKFRETRWTATEWNNIIQQSFYKWVAANKADYITNGYYDVANEFSWNYKEVLDIDNEALPGYWRGIFDHYYDTQTPHVTPWEMLGFSSMPTWWTSTALISGDAFTGYGLGPWPDTDPMWIDIEAGLIKRQVDNVTGDLVIGYTDLRYARPDLITKYLPVDMLGALKASPLLCIDVGAALDNPTAAQASADYNWADWSPVEYAWRTSESYPFAVCEAMFLARPGEFGEKFWDPEHIYEVAVDQEQIVSDFDGVYKRIGNADLIVHGETVGGVPQIQTGYQVWIAGQLKSLKKNLSTDFGDLVRSLDVKLGHKMAAFTDKDTLRVFVEGISVTSASSNLLVPAENIDVALYTGAPVQDYFYGGVLIKALPNDVYQVFGYDMTAGRFEYYPRVPAAGDTDVTVGGTPEKFSQFAIGNTYQLAQIVRLNGIFYRCIEVHTATTFDTTKWLKLAKLPITGGVSVTYRKKGADSKDAILYGTKLNGIQQVFDFLVGYGDAQEEDGWTFETVNTANNSINNWLQSAKDYLFWVGTQWEANSLIMLSPMADKVILNVQEGYPANVEKIINGTYSILDKNGVSIDPINTLINREDRLLEVMPDLEQTGIYGLHVITRETENIITFDNTTVFNDVLYDPVLGSRLARLDFRGRRTLEWTGKLEAAGFIITASGLLPNYENMVNSIRNYHNTEVILDNPNIEATARHLIGFDERDYFTDLGILDDAQFQFYQGMVRQKGTRQSIEKMVRNKLVTNTDSELNIIEEWALRLDSYGAVCLNQFTEFLIAADEVRVDPQLVQLYYPATEITPFTHAFDAANDVVGNTIAIVGHGYRTGAPKVYTFVNEGSDSIVGGLTSGSIYYVIVIDDDTFSLATTRNNAVATTPVAIALTPGVGVAHTLSAFPTGRVTNIDIVSATNVYTIAPTIFITNHPDDTTGSGATATSVLDTDGTLLRIDMLTGGTGYSLPPRIAIGLLTITATSDRATSRIVFDIGTDVDSDDVIKIDIDDSSRWITRPNSVACDVALEIWPEVAPTNYNTPNAGYVHADDIDFMAFAESDIDSLSTGSVIPTTHGELIWVARDAREGFGVYMLDGYKASTIINQTHVDFNNTAPNGTFTIGDGYVVNERITLSDGTVIRVDSVTGGPPGTVTTFTVLSASTTAFAARGGTTLTAVSSDGAGLGFTLTAGIANEGNGAALPGTGATVTQAPVIEDDGYVTFASIPREDVIPAQFTIDVGGNIIDAVTIVDGGLGYTRDGEFSITDATHGDGHNDTAIIEYRVTTGGDPLTFDGTIQEANVKAGSEGTDYFVKIDTAAINVKGAGYSLNDVLTITGGTGTSATLTVSELSTIAAQDEAVFDGVTAGEGTFTAGTGHTINDVITLTDGSTITINNATVSTITGQTQVNFDNSPAGEGTFTGGSDYLIGELLTMSDGTIIQVEGTLGAAGDPTIVPLVGIPIAEFRIVSPSTATTIYNNEVLTVSVNPGSGGQGFTLTLDVDNVEVTPTTGIVSEFTVTSATTTGITEQAATLAQASSTGTGVNFDITLGDTNQSVFDVTVTTQGRYSNDASLPSATAAATTVVPSGGTGATVDLTFLDDGIVVATDDLPVPTGWRRYMGNAVQDEGQIYAGNVLYDYERVSGSTYLLSKDGTPIENGTLAANTPFFTLLNLRFRTVAERTIFEPVLALAIADGSHTWTDINANSLWEVQTFTAPSTFVAYRTQEDLIDTSKFVNAYVYDNDTKDTLAQIPVYDPYKGILPGNADLNIRWKRARDPARYTNAAAAGTDPADAAINASKLVDADLAFDGDQVGLLWWDTSTSAYMYYEQGTDTYRRDNWGRLFQGSSVDIYEWTRSTLPPASYTGDGIVRNTTDYVLKQEWDSILETVRTFYYFWVKNRTNIPGGVNRTVAAFEVANIITNPLANLYQWFSPISQSGFVFAGVDSVFTDSDNVFQINYRYNDDVRPTHVQWELGRENDASYIVNDIHWNKMVDSLVGYTAEIDIGAMAHTDTIASFNTDATGVDSGTEKITTLTDHGLVSGDGVYYSKAGGIENINLTDGTMYYVEYLSDTELYLHLTNHAAKPIPPTPVNPASRIDITSAGLEVHTLTAQTLELNNFNNALPTAADPLRGYLIVPDPSLSDSNKLGISTRPVQSMFLNIQDARRVWVDKINELVFDIILRDDHPTWNAAMTTNTLWEWVDWYADGYDATNAVPVRQVADTSDLASLPNPFDGDIVKVQGPRYSLYEYSIDSGLYTLIMREDSRLNLLSTIYTDEPSLQASLELRELITALQTQVFVNDSVVNNNLVFFAMLNYVFSEQEDLDWAFKSTYIFIDQTGQVLSQPRVFQEDPFDSALAYITEVKPYQTKIRDYRITRATEIDELPGTASELSRLFTPYLVYDQIRGGDLSITEMRIAKREGQLSASYKGYSLINDVRLRNGGTGYALDDVLTVVGGTFTTPMTISVTGISGGIITAIGVIDAGVYTVLPGTAATTTVAPSGGTGALIDYASITQVRLGAAGRAVQNYRAELIDIQAPANNGLALIDYSPVTVVPTTEELESIAAINAAITTEFFFDYQGSLLQNTSFGGYPTLQSYTISAPGINYVIGDILQLAAGSGTPISNAQFRVSGIGGSGEITILDLVDGGSYVQTPTIDPVPLLGGSGTGASLTALIFQNGASVPHDSTPWDQIGFESSAHDPSVTTLDGSLTNVITTIPGQTQSSYNGIAPNGSFFGGAGYVAGSAANNYTTGLVFANVGSADTITRTDGTAFDTAGQFSPGQKLIVTASEDAANNGTFTILSVTPTVITLSPSDVLIDSATPPDTTAQLARYDTISMSDGPGGANGTDITVDIVSAGVVTQFTITGGSTAYITAGDTILQSTTSGSGTGFTITTAPATVTTGSFADIPAEETFSGNGSTREFTITTTVPTFFMFVVVDGVEQILNVDFFFIGSKLVFITAPPSGTNNVELYTYIEAGDLINPQVSAGISEEMVPLDPRENLVVIADTQTVTLVAAGTGYAVGEILTLTAGTFTQAMTVQVTAETGGVIDSIVLVDSGEYTVLPGVASPVTSDLAGNNDATITASSDPLSFRIHNDTQQNLLITRNADSMSTTVTVLITSADAVIPVVDVTALYTTPPTRSAPQVAWIGTERIIFHGVNLAANELVGVIRASNGTHAPIGGHPIGTKVFGTEGQTVPTPNVYWVNSATTSYQTGTPTNGIWIYNGHNNIHFSDVVVSTMVTTDSIVVGDTLRVTASIDASIQNSYFIKDIINPGEVGIVIIDNEGSGYSVGDVIPLTGLTVALGPPTTPAVLTVGGVDEDGAITYVYVNDRGTGYTPGGVSINLTGIGDGNASLTLDTLNEGVVLAQGGDIIGTGGVISENFGVSWELDRARPNGLTDATTAAAIFIQAEPGNALSIP